MDVLPAPFHRAPELNEFRDSVRRFVDTVLIPLEFDVLHDHGLNEQNRELLRERSRQAGWWMMDIPEALGGQGLSLEAMSVFWEEVSRSCVLTARDHDVFGPRVGPILSSLTGELK
ncbi:MAG: acyl-CoA dehydrogenase family protein, partial [Pigmentiphaga sp.]|nr:acyl-CoA dehydrogenase family protein [Pigmentiphaga sp.]